MTFSYSWHRLIAGISHTRRLYGSGLSSVHATASRPMVQGLRPAYRLLRVPWLLCSSLTVAVRHSSSFAVRATELYYNSEPRSSNPYVRECSPPPVSPFSRRRAWKMPSISSFLGRLGQTSHGPRHTAHGYSSMLIRPSCPFLLASCATIYTGHCAVLTTGCCAALSPGRRPL
jgi:hypothetical protein